MVIWGMAEQEARGQKFVDQRVLTEKKNQISPARPYDFKTDKIEISQVFLIENLYFFFVNLDTCSMNGFCKN